MTDIRPISFGAVASLVCSGLAWGGALLTLLALIQAGGNSADGTAGIIWLLISAPLVLITVVLWLIGIFWGCVVLARIRRASPRQADRRRAQTALGLGLLLPLVAGLTAVIAAIPHWIQNDSEEVAKSNEQVDAERAVQAEAAAAQETAEAWKAAGAKVGWMRVNEVGFLDFTQEKPNNDAGVLPAFRFDNWQAGLLAKLPAPPSAFALDLPDAPVADDDLRELAQFASLKYLALPRSRLTDDGLKKLANLQGVRALSLGSTKALLGHGLEDLSSLKELQALNLLSLPSADLDELGVATARLMQDALKKLAHLKDLRALCLVSTPVDDLALKELSAMKKLQALSLSGSVRVTDKGMMELAELRNLQALFVDHTQLTDKGLKTLAGLQDLQQLNLGNTKVTDAGVAELQKALPRCAISR